MPLQDRRRGEPTVELLYTFSRTLLQMSCSSMSVMSSTGRTTWGIALAPLKERRRGWKENKLLLKHTSIYGNLKKKQCCSSSDLLAHHILHSSGFCAPGCTCPQALPLELGWGVPPPWCGTECEAGMYVPGSSCGLPEFPWTAEVSGVAVQKNTSYYRGIPLVR